MLKVSVILPTFNRSQQLMKAIDSVLCQTHPVDEIVVVNDGSTDDTLTVLNEFMRIHKGVPIVVLSQENKGPAAARNFAIKAATGDLIAFLDDDDIWHPEKIERQLTVFLLDTKLDLLGCASNILRLYNALYLVRLGECAMLFRNWLMTPTVIVRRSVVLACGGFPEELPIAEDFSLWLRIVVRYRCSFLNEELVSCGYGKPPFGYSGLLENLDILYTAEREVYRRWRKERRASFFSYILVLSFFWARHFRRKLLVLSRRVRQKYQLTEN